MLLIKEIGTDALFTFNLVARQVDEKYGTNYLERVKKYHAECRDRDLSMAVAQTDAKGDRSLLPSQQTHPDYYVHIVERRPDGIVVRGAKAHTTGTVFVDEVIVLPTRALSSLVVTKRAPSSGCSGERKLAICSAIISRGRSTVQLRVASHPYPWSSPP